MQKSLTIEQTEELSGISSARLYRLERGSSPRVNEVRVLCKCLDISADWWLLGRSASEDIVESLAAGLSKEGLLLALQHVQKRLDEGDY